MSTVPFQPSPMLDRLSTYEIAILEFSSPGEVTGDELSNGMTPLLLTSKISYLWAGALAHVFENRPNLTAEEVLDFVRFSIQNHASQLREVYLGPISPQNLFAQTQLGLDILSAFLRAAELPEDAVVQVAHETEKAVNRLQEAGLIQDPLKKWVRNLLLSTTLLIPVNYTSTTGPGNTVRTEINSIAVSYVEEKQGQHTERHVKIKVQKAVKAFKEKLVPAIEDVVGDLSEK